MENSTPLLDCLWILMFGGSLGWLCWRGIKGSGMGLAADVSIGVIGGFLGRFLSDRLGLNQYSFWVMIGISMVGSVFFLTTYRIASQTRWAVQLFAKITPVKREKHVS